MGNVNSLVSLPDRHGGAARLSVFFALWTLALLVVHDVRVNAAPILEPAPSADTPWLTAPAPAPSFNTATMWNALAQQSEVMSGRWNGGARSQAKSIQAVAHTAAKRAATVASYKPPPAREATLVVKDTSEVSGVEVQVVRRIAVRDFSGAIAMIGEARAENPKAVSRLRVLEAHVAIGQGDYERAYALLLEGLPDMHVSTQQHDLLAAVMVRTSRYAEAAAVYRALLTLDSTNTRWWAGYAVTQEKLGRTGELAGAYRTLRTLAPPGTPLAEWAEQRLQRIG
jgi:hypothetical protein